MTLTQTLERLAVVAPEWIHFEHDTGHVTLKIDGFMHIDNYCIAIGGWTKQQLSLIFGACCEKIEAEGWGYILEHPPQNSGFRIFESQELYSKDVSFASAVGDNDCHAAASALLAALEGRVEKCAKCDAGYIEKGLTHKECPECQGSGQKQSEKLNISGEI